MNRNESQNRNRRRRQCRSLTMPVLCLTLSAFAVPVAGQIRSVVDKGAFPKQPAMSSELLAPGTIVTDANKPDVAKIANGPAAPFDADDTLNQLLTGLVLKNMPHNYTRDKDWGQQDERWDGLKVRRDGWKIHTKRRKKLVNHGTWKKYSAKLIDPEHQFDVTMTNIRQTVDEKLAFQINFSTALKIDARQSQWVKGVQMYSLSADGKAKVRLTVDMTLGIALDPTSFPPDVVFNPVATSAKLSVDEFRIDHISSLGGEFAQQVTRLARREMDDEIAEKEAELVKKINKEIEENRDELRLSMSKAMQSKWAEKAAPFLPAEIKQAVEGDQ